MKDKILLYKFENLLKSDFDKILSQISINNRRIDFIVLDGKKLIGIEVKSRYEEILKAIGQCLFYKDGVHKIFIALPEGETNKIRDELKILKKSGIGLISIGEKYKIILNAIESKPNKELLNKILNKIKLLSKISKYVNDYKALGHSIRFQIYLLLYEKEKVKLKEMVSELEKSYPLILKHIKILEDANLIKIEKNGKETIIKIKSQPKEIGDITKNKILSILLDHSMGLTVTQVSKILNLNYMTASKYLAILEAVGKVECRKIGMAKLFGVKK